MSDWQWAVAWAVLAAGGLIQGAAGFGSAVVAAPVLAMLDPALVPGPMLACATIVSALMMVRERAAIDARGFWWAMAGRLPGTAAGAAVTVVASKRWIGVLLAVAVLAGVAASVRAPRITPGRRTLFGAGVVSGLFGTAASIGGPPVALAYQSQPGPTIRSTLAAYLTAGSTISLAVLAAVGGYGTRELRATAALAPALVAGLAASGPLTRALDRRHMRNAVLVVSALAAGALLAQSALS